MRDKILEKRFLWDIIRLTISYIFYAVILFFSVFMVGISGVLEIAKLCVQVAGIILGFSFIAIASLFQFIERSEEGSYLISVLLDVVFDFVFVLMLSLLTIFLVSFPSTLWVLLVIIIVFAWMLLFLSEGAYLLLKSIRKIREEHLS